MSTCDTNPDAKDEMSKGLVEMAKHAVNLAQSFREPLAAEPSTTNSSTRDQYRRQEMLASLMKIQDILSKMKEGSKILARELVELDNSDKDQDAQIAKMTEECNSMEKQLKAGHQLNDAYNRKLAKIQKEINDRKTKLL
jgi:DNA mismatch repair ATPase MutS